MHVNTIALKGRRCHFPAEAGVTGVVFVVRWVPGTEPGSQEQCWLLMAEQSPQALRQYFKLTPFLHDLRIFGNSLLSSTMR